MSHKHYCDVAGHEWVCTDITCECICGKLMEDGDHSECPIELRACPEHQGQLLELSDDELSAFVGDLTSNAEKLAANAGARTPILKMLSAPAYGAATSTSVTAPRSKISTSRIIAPVHRKNFAKWRSRSWRGSINVAANGRLIQAR